MIREGELFHYEQKIKMKKLEILDMVKSKVENQQAVNLDVLGIWLAPFSSNSVLNDHCQLYLSTIFLSYTSIILLSRVQSYDHLLKRKEVFLIFLKICFYKAIYFVYWKLIWFLQFLTNCFHEFNVFTYQK